MEFRFYPRAADPIDKIMGSTAGGDARKAELAGRYGVVTGLDALTPVAECQGYVSRTTLCIGS